MTVIVETVNGRPVCNCGDEYAIGGCPIHVGCDDECGALLNPVIPGEVQAALEHWRSHSRTSGCSHGR